MIDYTDFVETAPIWMQTAGTTTIGPCFTGTCDADLVVVGGGIAGLTAAYYARDALPTARIVVLEAERIGYGTTGRSTGIVTPGMKMSLGRCRRKYGADATIAGFDASQRGVTLLRHLIRTEGIACAAGDDPHTRVALTESHRRHQTDQLARLAKLGYRFDLITDEALAARVGPGYLSGTSFDDAMLVDPYRLATGLADVLRRENVEVYERSRVVTVDPDDGTPIVATPNGRIRATSVLLTLNGYAGKLNPHPSSLFTVRGYSMATIPLTDRQLGDLGWNGRGAIIDERNFFNHYRLTPDNRLLFGGGPTAVPHAPVRDSSSALIAYRRLHQELLDRFPSLDGVPIAARWSALEAGTLDRLPVVGWVPRQNGVFFAGGWTGHGLSTSVAAAWQFARRLVGNSPGPIPWLRSDAPKIPIGFARTAGMSLYLRLLDRVDRRDRKTAVAAPLPRPAEPVLQ